MLDGLFIIKFYNTKYFINRGSKMKVKTLNRNLKII